MLTAPKALELYYLETRCMLLEIAAVLDRIDRGAQSDSDGNGKTLRDPRLDRIYQSLELLAERPAEPNRAERLLNLFSDPS